jgi:hypothetical protein
VFSLFTLLVLNTMPPPAAAQDFAPGYWRDTCRNVDRDGSVINADCRTVDGRWRRTALDLRTCQGSTVSNSDGVLVCDYASAPGYAPNYVYAPNYDRFPSGSWRYSCNNAELVGNDLVAVCVKRDGYTNKARLDLGRCPAGPVYNDNGRLLCGDNTYGTRYGLPDGQWRETCNNPKMDGSVLIAYCKHRGGANLRTSIDLDRCPGQRIRNLDGDLVCETR